MGLFTTTVDEYLKLNPDTDIDSEYPKFKEYLIQKAQDNPNYIMPTAAVQGGVVGGITGAILGKLFKMSPTKAAIIGASFLTPLALMASLKDISNTNQAKYILSRPDADDLGKALFKQTLDNEFDYRQILRQKVKDTI